MENLTESKLPIAPIDDIDLEKISGGNLYVEGYNFYNLISNQLQAVLTPFADDLNEWENKVRYADVLKALRTYDTSSKSATELANFYANSWNQKHPKGTRLNPSIARAILSVENEYDRAVIACLDTPEQMINALNALYNG